MSTTSALSEQPRRRLALLDDSDNDTSTSLAPSSNPVDSEDGREALPDNFLEDNENSLETHTLGQKDSSYKRPIRSGIHRKSPTILHQGVQGHTGGTKNMKDHLQKRYNITFEADGNLSKILRREEGIKAALIWARSEAEIKRQEQVIQAITVALDKKALGYLYIKWIITSDVPFRQTGNEDFRTFIRYINSVANWYLPNSSTTI